MVKYIYESHLGGCYTTDEPMDYEDLYCEQCGDSDSFIGQASTREEALELLKNYYGDETDFAEFIEIEFNEN